ncbi:MAG: hypothetical protein AB8F65_01910 [Woeseiaceae bacterium]
MKLFVKLLMLIMLLALAGPFFLKGPDGAPLWTVRETLGQAKSTLSRWWGKAGVESLERAVTNEVTVYRWQDADGVWQFSAEKPEGTDADVMLIDTGNNAIEFVQPVLAAEAEPAETDELDTPDVPESPMIGPYPSPEATRELIDDVRALQEQSEERLRQIDGI